MSAKALAFKAVGYLVGGLILLSLFALLLLPMIALMFLLFGGL